MTGLVPVIVMFMVFSAVVLIVLAIGPLLAPRVNLSARLSSATASELSAGNSPLRNDHSASIWARLVHEVERRGFSLNDTKADILAHRLMLAGFDQPWAVRAFVLARTVLTLFFPLVIFIMMQLSGKVLSPAAMYMLLVGSAIFGLYLPNLIIGSRASNRKQEILNGFPDTLDLMLVCVEAGLGLDAAFSRVGSEIVKSHPLIARLFAAVSLELRAGRTREVALRNLSRRTAVPEIGAFVTLIIQSDKLGASIATALKVYAGEMREARRMRAEEKAHRIPVLLSVPLVCFLLPTMVSVLMVPAVINMRHSMSAATSGGATSAKK